MSDDKHIFPNLREIDVAKEMERAYQPYPDLSMKIEELKYSKERNLIDRKRRLVEQYAGLALPGVTARINGNTPSTEMLEGIVKLAGELADIVMRET